MNAACTFDQVLLKSSEWCAKHPAWVRICDMPDGYVESLYVQWEELCASHKRQWGSEYGYNEFATRRCKVQFGCISSKGEFYDSLADVPIGHQSMMVFKVGKKAAFDLMAFEVQPSFPESRRSKAIVHVTHR